MNATFEVLQQIEDTGSSKSKMELLVKNQNNQNLLKLLRVTYHPYIQFYLKKLPEVRPAASSSTSPEEFYELLRRLSERVVTGNSAISEVQDFLNRCTKTEIKWYSKVIQKDLKIGITETTINKVFNNAIPVFGCTLAEEIKNLDLEADKRLPENFLVEAKLDGMRILAFVTDKGVELKSRNGRLIHGYDKLEKELFEVMPHGYVYDGELMASTFEDFLDKVMALRSECRFEEAMSLLEEEVSFNKLMMDVFRKTNDKSAVFNVFDVVPIDEFSKGVSNSPLEERKALLDSMVKSSECIKFVPGVPCNKESLDKLKELYNTCLELGYEGVMIKKLGEPYIYKRSWNTIKLKPTIVVDLEVEELYEGKPGTRNEGRMGGAYVRYNGELVGVGGGWSDLERIEFWNQPNRLIGKVIEVEAQEPTTNQRGTVSLRFPRKKRIRQDK